MTDKEQSMARDKQRVVLAKCFLVFMVLWFGFIIGMVLADKNLDPLLAFGLGTVTGGLMIILSNIYQFFFRTSGDKSKEVK